MTTTKADEKVANTGDTKDSSICFKPDFGVTTSLKWSSSVSLAEDAPKATPISFHQSRLLASAKTFGLDTASERLSGTCGQRAIIDAIDKHMSAVKEPHETHKLTLLVSLIGEITVTSSLVTQPLYDFSLPKASSRLTDNVQAKVYISSHATNASFYTLHKTNHRPMYAAARSAAGIEHEAPTSTEVLLYNQEGQITEASLSTVYFLRNNSWITPASQCGGNLGATRALALSRGWCIEGLVGLKEVVPDEIIILSNGVRGFWAARIVGADRL